jgi:hypothetical protein
MRILHDSTLMVGSLLALKYLTWEGVNDSGNTLAYLITAKVTALKSFIDQSPDVSWLRRNVV